jgi:hypothetical protein
MMQDLNVLTQLVKTTAQVPLEEEYGKHLARLTEPQAPDSEAIIRNIPEDAMVIKVDLFFSPDKIFNGNNGECKRCDYVIISPGKRCILYIEIKRTKDKGGWKHIVEQLKGGQCFVSYCQTVGEHFWDKKDFLSGYKNRFICIGHTNIAKRKTRIDKQSKRHNTPDKAMKIDWPNHLQFNHLAGLGV